MPAIEIKAKCDHWNKVYSQTERSALGWFEADPQPSARLIHACGLAKDAVILDVGSGSSSLIPHLLDEGYTGLHALDLSAVALESARALLHPDQVSTVKWLVADITERSALKSLDSVDLWHDRAVFHFQTEDVQRQAYRAQLLKKVHPGAYVLLATFGSSAPNKCSGLPVIRYDHNAQQDFMNPEFELIQTLDHLYTMPSGDTRPFVYSLFQRKSN